MRLHVLETIASRLLWVTTVALVFPCGLSLALGEGLWLSYLAPAGVAGVLASALGRHAARKGKLENLRRREGFLAVTFGWLILVVFTATAYFLTGAFPTYAGAFFESMSGFTTTGASVISDVDGLADSITFMRAFSQWLGGMGIIVLSVAILPELAVGGLQLFSAESSGIDADKLAPRIASTARRLWGLYVGMTAILTVLLTLAGGLSFFDSLLHAMATIATGGFSNYTASVGAFDSLFVEICITVFMFISGISFSLQFRAFILGQPKRLLRSPETRLYTALTLLGILFVTFDLFSHGNFASLGDCLRYASFQVVSVVTTTGFGTTNFDLWPDFSKLLLVCLMLMGGCAGSTAGGFKVVRLYVVLKHALVQLRRLVRPRIVQTIHVGTRRVPAETTEGILGFLLLYGGALISGSLLLSVADLDFVGAVTASISALNSIGPGLGAVGPAENFGHVSSLGLYGLSFGMLLGRLEIYTVLVLFTRHFWRRG